MHAHSGLFLRSHDVKYQLNETQNKKNWLSFIKSDSREICKNIEQTKQKHQLFSLYLLKYLLKLFILQCNSEIKYFLKFSV